MDQIKIPQQVASLSDVHSSSLAVRVCNVVDRIDAVDTWARAIDRRVVPTYVPVADWSRDSWTPCLVQQASIGMLRGNGINEITFQ